MMPTNREIADLLDELADLLDAQEADQHRVRAYRRAARSVRGEDSRSLEPLFEEQGEEGLRRIPGVGEGLAGVIAEYLRTGRSTLRDDLSAKADPAHLFRQLPGISEKLARRILEDLDVRTLEELELAAHDGRLKQVKGFGSQRVQAVKEVLAGRLSRSARKLRRRMETEEPTEEEEEQPPVSVLLDIDREYRQKAEEGELRTIAPRRFNPKGEAWLPIMKTDRQRWSFTALYSNTSRAHELGKTRDWVVIYYRSNGREDQCTVTTGQRGRLKGRRVVRGREQECAAFYER
jgi:hypothetical protein